ncbi:peptidyl-prolyl cis-trans isomerase B (cyclophilin B) [Micromonospora sp. M71_S20]|uniref:peptidylprolyl isomerase n=1 Tax=Micromonospora sp. M71_S20 TaxID=592872 RepID=UPI000F1454BC|nr:peptidyl-prolyl cis-trans isomerase B (cyclophilin B) [Micromonospora sp. M71_S20]
MSSEPRPHPVPPSIEARRRPARTLSRLAGVALVAGALVTGGGAAAVAAPAGAPADASAGARITPGPCAYTETPEDPAARPVPLPPDPRRTPDRGTVRVTLRTNQGPIGLTLDREAAPCTVQSFLHLVRHRFYDRTSCHRLTAYPTLRVLQCGDPSGTGSGGPGYRYADELPTDLPPAPTDPTGVRRLYARGTLAMANAGPDTNGSQFFLVQGDSALRPNYTVFGSIDAAGLATLDRIAAGGIAPTVEDPAPVDGAPALPVDIRRAVRHHHQHR